MAFRHVIRKYSYANCAFTFPALSVELTEDVIKRSKIAPALRRIGTQLLKQYTKAGPRNEKKDTVGIVFTTIEFNFLLKPSEKT